MTRAPVDGEGIEGAGPEVQDGLPKELRERTVARAPVLGDDAVTGATVSPDVEVSRRIQAGAVVDHHANRKNLSDLVVGKPKRSVIGVDEGISRVRRRGRTRGDGERSGRSAFLVEGEARACGTRIAERGAVSEGVKSGRGKGSKSVSNNGFAQVGGGTTALTGGTQTDPVLDLVNDGDGVVREVIVAKKSGAKSSATFDGVFNYPSRPARPGVAVLGVAASLPDRVEKRIPM